MFLLEIVQFTIFESAVDFGLNSNEKKHTILKMKILVY
ncbi:hypothetical protein LEP1GSC166_3938 [Leptospira kirschneri]|nr:hypothetical protein LEP1GSC198_2881 [Leptospira kirschneri str. JB]EMK02696.1 hypothetical protein LEP1GSC166_3938 [Leptospira kirschneri]